MTINIRTSRNTSLYGSHKCTYDWLSGLVNHNTSKSYLALSRQSIKTEGYKHQRTY